MKDKSNQKEEKRKYEAPRLKKYGDLKKITQAKGADREDGGSAKTWDKGMP